MKHPVYIKPNPPFCGPYVFKKNTTFSIILVVENMDNTEKIKWEKLNILKPTSLELWITNLEWGDRCKRNMNYKNYLEVKYVLIFL